MNYATIDFKVTKDPNRAETYLVAATTRDRRTEQSSFQLRSTLWEDLDALFMKLYARTAQPDDKSRVQDYGKELYDALLQGPVRTLFDERYTYAETHQDSGLRLCLRILPPELISLPWEIMYDRRKAEFLCLMENPKILFLRRPEHTRRTRPASYSPPLHILVVAPHPEGYVELDADQEKDDIKKALKDLEETHEARLEYGRGTSIELQDLKLQSQETPVHAYHLICHGSFRDGEGQLYFENEQQKAKAVSASRFRRSLPLDTQLVFLNGCQTAQGDEIHPLSSITASLADKGIPAVVGMQFKISDQAAIRFAKTFYTTLAQGHTVDEAVADGRMSIAIADRSNPLDWAAPILYSGSSNLIFFKKAPSPGPKTAVQDPPVTPPDPPPPGPSKPPVRPKHRGLVSLIALAIAALILIAAILVIPARSSTLTTLCIGVDFPTSHGAEDQSDVANGAELAIEQNANLGSGYKLLANCADKNDDNGQGYHDIGVGLKNLRELIADPRVLGTVGPGDSDIAFNDLVLAFQANMVMVSPDTTSPCLTQPCDQPPPGPTPPAAVVSNSPYVRIGANDLQQGLADADFLYRSLGLSSAFVVSDGTFYGQGLAQFFSNDLKDDGGTIVGMAQISNQDTPDEFMQIARKISSLHPAAVFYGGYAASKVGSLKVQLDRAGFRGPLMSGDDVALSSQYLNDAGLDADNTYATSLERPVSQLPSWFTDAYNRRYGSNPGQNSASGYDSAMVLINAIKRVIATSPQTMHSDVKTIRAAVLANVKATSGYAGPTTGTTITLVNGDNAAVKFFTVYEVIKGKWSYQSTYNVAP